MLFRISVIFRVRSAKAVKITDMDLIKRTGVIVAIFVLFLLIRTLVSPPQVIIGKSTMNLTWDSINIAKYALCMFLPIGILFMTFRKNGRRFESVSLSI